MALYKNEVGPSKESRLYVWSQAKGRPSQRACVISAHGGEAKINGMASTPQTSLTYYCPHGRPLNDPSIEAIIAKTVHSYGDPVDSRASQDYELSKYTNTGTELKHNKAGESYARIGKLDERFAEAHALHAGAVGWLVDDVLNNDALLPQLTEQSALEQRYRELAMDVVTIRNRFWLKSPKLSEVLTELWKYGYQYADVHCSFCRGSAEGYKPLKVDLTA